MSNKPVSRKTDIVIQKLENEVLVYDLKKDKAFCLNQTSAIVYELSDGNTTAAEISDLMSKKLKKLVSEDFVWLAINELAKCNLLENEVKLTDHFAGLSRREIVRRVGFASMIALPIIASVSAPQPAMAQSCAANGQSCTFAGNTQSNCCNSSQRCYDSAGISPTCRDCFPSGSGPQAVCAGAGCCAARADKNKCCSNSYNEVMSGGNILCFCA